MPKRPAQTAVLDPVEQLVARARRMRSKGEAKRSLTLLREACCLAEQDARLWTLYSIQCWRLGQRNEGRRALRQALWLRERERDESRVRVLKQLLLAMESACAPDELRAA
ncbi:MAG TPA: hypothetical protein VFQ61_29065 [Polyangiaceae bacterium]|nr:hypothetical protein [Polyangiaceae bacterium]